MQKLPGHRVSGKCVKPTTKNKNKSHCTRLKRVAGSIVLSGKAGTNSFTWRGRIGGHKLKPGSYILIVTPSASGLSGTPRRASFQILG